MKIFLSAILLCSSLFTFGQNARESYALTDSMEININENFNHPVLVKPDLFIPLSAINSFYLPFRLGLNPFFPPPEDNSGLNTDLLYPSQPIFDKQNKFSFLYTMLGAVQTGAVGYMAFKHIKKYGLFK